jgi:hypothetical protein
MGIQTEIRAKLGIVARDELEHGIVGGSGLEPMSFCMQHSESADQARLSIL